MKVALVGLREEDAAFVEAVAAKADRVLALAGIGRGKAFIVDPETIIVQDLRTGEVTRPILDLIEAEDVPG